MFALNTSNLARSALLACFALAGAPVLADELCPKYGNCVPEAAFDCQDVDRSSVVKRVCYNEEKSYLIIRLTSAYYHYCEIDKTTVGQFLAADSMGSFYSSNIKDSGTGGAFSCKGKTVPTF